MEKVICVVIVKQNSPAHQITFAVSYQEAIEIRDLISGTLFKLELDSFFGELGIE